MPVVYPSGPLPRPVAVPQGQVRATPQEPNKAFENLQQRLLTLHVMGEI